MDTNPIWLVSLQVRRLVYTHAQSWKEETLGKAAPSVKERGLEKICYSQFLGVTHLPTPWLWRPVSRSVRQWMSAVWAAWVVGLCHGSLSNVMCGRQRYHWGCTGAGEFEDEAECYKGGVLMWESQGTLRALCFDRWGGISWAYTKLQWPPSSHPASIIKHLSCALHWGQKLWKDEPQETCHLQENGQK